MQSRPRTPNPKTFAIRRVRGNGLSLATAAARAAVGESGWSDLLDSLSPAARNLLEAPHTAEDWLDAGTVAECVGRFHEIGRPGPVPAVLEVETTRARTPDAFRSPAHLVEALPRFWRGFVDGGRLEATLDGPSRAQVTVWAHWPVPYFFETHLPAWLSHGLTLAGAACLTVRHGPPAGAGALPHRYDLTWTGPTL